MSKRQTLHTMEARDAAHAGLVPLRYAPCRICHARIDLAASRAERAPMHRPDCRFRNPELASVSGDAGAHSCYACVAPAELYVGGLGWTCAKHFEAALVPQGRAAQVVANLGWRPIE